MRPSLPLLLSTALILPAAALADLPRIVTDTAPVHSLVSIVTGDLGQPALLLPPGTSPHDAALRPSDAAALSGAEVVIWTGPGLVPFLADPIATLAPQARVVALLESDGWTALPLRTHPNFQTHDHDHGHEEAGHGDADHDHDHDEDHDHADHDHGDGDHDEADHDDHGHDDHDHAHGADGIDPHAWLDPAVAAIWVGTIAETLAAADPDNAATYRANAGAAAADFAALRDRIAADLAPLAGRPYVVPHDGYQYFETAFGLPAAGAIALSDAAAPGPAHVAALKDRIAAEGIACVLTDPQTSPDLTALVIEGTEARSAMADPDGQNLPPGPDLYPALVRGIAAALRDCLGG